MDDEQPRHITEVNPALGFPFDLEFRPPVNLSSVKRFYCHGSEYELLYIKSDNPQVIRAVRRSYGGHDPDVRFADVDKIIADMICQMRRAVDSDLEMMDF